LENNSNFFERLMYYADLQGIKNPNELAKRLGYASAEKLYRLERKENAKPSADIITDITNEFEFLNLRWLLTGKGSVSLQKPDYSPITKRDEIRGMIAEPDDSPTYKREFVHPKEPKNVHPAVHPTTQNTKFKAPKVVTVDHNGRDNIVLVHLPARAGYLLGYGDPEYIAELPSYSVPRLQNGTFRAFEVEGISMVPTINHGDIVFAEWVEQLAHITDDRVYVIVTKSDGILVKRLINRVDKYGFIIAKSDSIDNRAQYPNLNIAPDQIIELWEAKMFLGSNFGSPHSLYTRLADLEADFAHFKSKKGLK